MVLAVDEFSVDDASLCGQFFSIHGRSNSGNSMKSPSRSILRFCCLSCPTSASSWAWGTQSKLSTDGFLLFQAGWLCLTTIAESSATQCCRVYFQIGSRACGRQRLTGRQRLSSTRNFGFPDDVCDSFAHSVVEGNASSTSIFLRFSLNFNDSLAAL